MLGDGFWCTDPSDDPRGTFWLQSHHMVHYTYNCLWMCKFIHHDWDMFQSTHPCANFRAISREISSCPVYNSEAGINHNFSLMLKQFVLPDGSILRCRYNALPIKDCFIEDPLHEGKTMLKIMNLNKFDGVTGAFNCQDNFLHIE
ncbi:seed imbibition 1-like, raffinose synthase 5 [Hibiscus trionum]|uniref:Seed imbibition 1-like, raffinose synthase 5 n=2 Tax=Hibiscus trionum TaxID=183268 RepID=A0A9W7IXQ4_HIBTR|nr:seed imbibition 1-like, raffinose synthase 5 [Hibiscus trionum]